VNLRPILCSITRIVIIPLLLDVKRSKRVAGEGETGVSVPIVIVVSLMDNESSSWTGLLTRLFCMVSGDGDS
jgi:hypothetical protein